MSLSINAEKVRIGIAGWGNPPDQRNARHAQQSHLQHYASQFSCTEINSSFHKAHQASTYRRWRDDTPPKFRFSVKMPRSITHETGLRRAAREVARFYEEIRPLRPKLKAVLVQLPPALSFSLRSARAFFAAATDLRGAVIACEPRHLSWFSDAADAALREMNVTRVAADPARCAAAGETGGARRFAYFRWHGTPRMYYSKYSDAQLLDFARQLARSRARQIWCIFDNTAHHAAWDDALRLRCLLQSGQVSTRSVVR